MKTLIFTLIFTLQAFAQGSPNQSSLRLTDAEISTKLVSVAVDIQNEQILANQQDLKQCRDDFQREYDPKPGAAGSQANQAATAKMEDCISKKIGTGQNAERIADSLNLETYKLVESKTVKTVTDYLTKNLYRQLTGVDLNKSREEKIRASLFKNKKQIDQSVFFQLYKNQMAKNALYEVSRFCFMDFRKSGQGTTSTDFFTHWSSLGSFTQGTPTPVLSAPNPPSSSSIEITDSGEPSFDRNTPTATATGAGGTQQSSNQPSDAYEVMVKNILGGSPQALDSAAFKNFFFFCGRSINLLCDDFETKCNRATQPGSPAPASCSGSSAKGAKACIAKTRLTAFRNALASTDKIMEEYNKDPGAIVEIALNPNQIVKRYGGAGDPTVNQLTNNSATSFIEATQNESTAEAQKCIDAGGAANDCEQFSINSDAENNIQTNTQLVYAAKRQAELVRVRELKQKGQQSLIEYIEKNYPDLKSVAETGNMAQLEERISNRWDAKREAMVKEIQDRIAKRQVTADEANATTGAGANAKAAAALENAQGALSERTRLGQVVLFNNIISSTLDLQDGSGKSLGRNTEALSGELDKAQSASIQSQYFQNLQTLAKDGNSGGSSGGSSGGIGANQSITNIQFLDEFIGIPKAQTANGNNGGGPNQ